jgi:hypothetical protein
VTALAGYRIDETLGERAAQKATLVFEKLVGVPFFHQ